MIEAKSCEETVCEDRISELPDDLLVTILDRVPTKDAVATMFLSKRWQSIWTMKLKLAYQDSDAGSDYDYDDDHEQDGKKSKKSVWRFLDKSLQLHKAPVLDSLCIELGPQCPTDVDVGKWVETAVDRRVTVLIFKLLWSAGPTRLPESFYTCETLQELTLSHKILVDFPSSSSSSSSCLRSLRFLQLFFVVYKDEDSILRFLSSCPNLRILVVIRKKDDNVKKITVKVPSLCQLCYHDVYVGGTGRCLVADTPALVKLSIIDGSTDHCSIDRMPCLHYASILTHYQPDERFLKSISSVRSLDFLSSQLVCFSAIYFPRLTKLSIEPRYSDWMEQLMGLLRNSPKVKNLHCRYRGNDLPPSWNQPSSIPECLSSNLDNFTWHEYGGRQEEKKFLTYILANAKCLKTTKISLTPTLSLEEQHMMMEKLKDIPTTSQLLFE
ncbi:unnamed protein product [Thlaspi arvense]|uniref:F-box domain-containing protein n=1 Tax=Thlaspi arvense TaxID=13288 RepID=A0AAU9S5T0_THLAR|nr:unnamed protein product [Thlaspi arvense]